jgi:hypothetical protein
MVDIFICITLEFINCSLFSYIYENFMLQTINLYFFSFTCQFVVLCQENLPLMLRKPIFFGLTM